MQSRCGEVLILGAYPIGLALTEDDYDVQALGLLFCSGHDGPLVGFAPDDPDRQSLLAEWFDTAHLWGGYAPHKFDFAARYGSFHYRMGGQYDGDHHLLPVSENALADAWKEAANRTQWRRPR